MIREEQENNGQSQPSIAVVSSVPCQVNKNHAPGAVRHAEKRRTGTCRFADRICETSLECFRSHIPSSFRDKQKQTCVSAIVAHFQIDGHLKVLGLGVGTKFLPEHLITEEEAWDNQSDAHVLGVDGHSYRRGYGLLLRDCHAEILARRAFRRQLYLDMQNPCDQSILEKCQGDNRYRLKSDVTLHMYSSSAPCGNATIKKFATMHKEVFDSNMDVNEWPCKEHERIPPHSLKLGQFSLLLKKDKLTHIDSRKSREVFDAGKSWPANKSDAWCPPGTTIVWSNQGSIHTCSDKICRWNVLGIQGSLLSSLLESPLFISSLTVGRKFTSTICRRAVCCRATEKDKTTVGPFTLHHPAIMGTGVYMDDFGTLDMGSESTFGQDVRFHSSECYAWWPDLNDDFECIDGSTGLATGSSDASLVSQLCTASMVRLHFTTTGSMVDFDSLTLESLLSLKRRLSPSYEQAKEGILTKHKLFRGWRRRGVIL